MVTIVLFMALIAVVCLVAGELLGWWWALGAFAVLFVLPVTIAKVVDKVVGRR
jgi:hypothetical protein